MTTTVQDTFKQFVGKWFTYTSLNDEKTYTYYVKSLEQEMSYINEPGDKYYAKYNVYYVKENQCKLLIFKFSTILSLIDYGFCEQPLGNYTIL